MTRFAAGASGSEDYCAIYYYYCEATPDCPKGRAAILLDGDTVLADGELGEARIPAFRLAPSERMLGPGGHSNAWDLLPLHEAYGSTFSAQLSNVVCFAQQYIAIPKNSGVKPHQLGEGLTSLEYDAGPDGRRVRELCLALYAESPVGCCLHVQIDDRNLHDRFFSDEARLRVCEHHLELFDLLRSMRLTARKKWIQ